jgi:hypothetical protein
VSIGPAGWNRVAKLPLGHRHEEITTSEIKRVFSPKTQGRLGTETYFLHIWG